MSVINHKLLVLINIPSSREIVRIILNINITFLLVKCVRLDKPMYMPDIIELVPSKHIINAKK